MLKLTTLKYSTNIYVYATKSIQTKNGESYIKIGFLKFYTSNNANLIQFWSPTFSTQKKTFNIESKHSKNK